MPPPSKEPWQVAAEWVVERIEEAIPWHQRRKIPKYAVDLGDARDPFQAQVAPAVVADHPDWHLATEGHRLVVTIQIGDEEVEREHDGRLF